MATAKATKAAKPAKSLKEETVEVKTLEQLTTDLAAKQNDLLEAKRGHRAGELVNPRIITVTRKEIARLHTAIRATELKETNS